MAVCLRKSRLSLQTFPDERLNWDSWRLDWSWATSNDTSTFETLLTASAINHQTPQQQHISIQPSETVCSVSRFRPAELQLRSVPVPRREYAAACWAADATLTSSNTFQQPDWPLLPGHKHTLQLENGRGKQIASVNPVGANQFYLSDVIHSYTHFLIGLFGGDKPLITWDDLQEFVGNWWWSEMNPQNTDCRVQFTGHLETHHLSRALLSSTWTLLTFSFISWFDSGTH